MVTLRFRWVPNLNAEVEGAMLFLPLQNFLCEMYSDQIGLTQLLMPFADASSPPINLGEYVQA